MAKAFIFFSILFFTGTHKPAPAKSFQQTVVYADNKRTQTFNIPERHKDKEGNTGIVPAADAKAVYKALLRSYNRFSGARSSLLTFKAKYFISRTDVIQTANQSMFESIRPIDKKDQGDSTISIQSNGEGWLDEDSLPVGQWKFYAKNVSGKEYLLKTGNYSRTNAAMFRVMNIDSIDLFNHYHLSFAGLQQGHASTIPFIKTGRWEYFHRNGKRWKSINYQTKQIPINTAISIMDPEDMGTSMLSVELKESPDEWINTEVTEYKEDGVLYKKLRYDNTGDVYQKTIYGKRGQIIRTETAKPHAAKLSAVND